MTRNDKDVIASLTFAISLLSVESKRELPLVLEVFADEPVNDIHRLRRPELRTAVICPFHQIQRAMVTRGTQMLMQKYAAARIDNAVLCAVKRQNRGDASFIVYIVTHSDEFASFAVDPQVDPSHLHAFG